MVVKLVITSACHAEGRGFESRPLRHFGSFHSTVDGADVDFSKLGITRPDLSNRFGIL